MRPDINRQSLWFANLVLLVLLALCWSRVHWAPAPEEALSAGEGALGVYLSRWLPASWTVTHWVYGVLALINAIRITRLASRNMVFVVRSFLPIIFFAMVCAGIYFTPGNISVMVAVWLFISGSGWLIASFKRRAGFGPLLRAGIAMGLMPLFSPVSIVLWAGVPAALLLFRRSGRESVVAVFGLLLPVLTYSYIVWLTGGDFVSLAVNLYGSLSAPTGYSPLHMTVGRMVAVSLLVLLVFLSVGTYLGMARSMRTKPARIIIYFIVTLLAGVAAFFLPCRSAALFPLLAVSAAVICPIYFVRHTGLVPAAIYLLVLASIVAINIAPAIL